MPSKPTRRSLKHLRDNGYLADVVERWLNFPGMKFPRRIDLFGIVDIVAVREDSSINTGYEILFVQTTDHTSFSKHRDKIVAHKNYKRLRGLIHLHGWAKRGPRGGRKVWTLREEVL
jgi:hypothetical protein